MVQWVEESAFSGGGIGMKNKKGLREGSKESSKQKTKIQYRLAKEYGTEPRHLLPHDNSAISIRTRIAYNRGFKTPLL
jgi:hypothetical protein